MEPPPLILPPRHPHELDAGGRAWFYFLGLVGAAAAILSGWIYSYIHPHKETVVITSARGFLDLLIVAWYMVMVLAFATALTALLCRCRKPMKHPVMAVVYGLLAAAWGLTCLLLTIAEITIAKRNEACKDDAGDQFKDGNIVRICYQGDFLNWYPTYIATIAAFLECVVWFGICVTVIEQKKERKKQKTMGFSIVVGDRVIRPNNDGVVSREEVAAALANIRERQAAEREAWVQEQMELSNAVEAGNVPVRRVGD